MGFISNQIHAAATETQTQWVQRIIDTITAIDPRITCDTTAAAQYADDSNTATFDFNINDEYILRFTRGAVNSSNTNGFIISMIVNNTEYPVLSNTRMWYTSGKADTAVTNGYFKVSAFLSQNNIFIWFGFHHDQEISDILPTKFGISLIADENNIYYCNFVTASNDIAPAGLYKCSDGTTGYSLVKCLNYAENVGNISLIENYKNPIASTGAFATFAKDLIACSTIAIGSSITIDGKNYFAVSTNIIAPVE